MTTLAPRVVVVHRRTELDELTARHGTRGQIAFFLNSAVLEYSHHEGLPSIEREAIASLDRASRE